MTFRANKLIDAASSGIDLDGVTIEDSYLRTRFSWQIANTATQSITAGSIREVEFNTTNWDTYPGGIVTLASNKVTAPVTGKYLCTFNTNIDDNAVFMKCYWYLNTTIVKNDFFRTYDPGDPWGSYNVILDVTAGDDISIGIRAYVSGIVIGSALTYQYARFAGYFIGS